MNLILAIPIEIRLAAVFVVGLLLGSMVNLAVYRFAWHARPIGPWSAPHPAAPARRRSDRLPVIGWLGLRREAPLCTAPATGSGRCWSSCPPALGWPRSTGGRLGGWPCCRWPCRRRRSFTSCPCCTCNSPATACCSRCCRPPRSSTPTSGSFPTRSRCRARCLDFWPRRPILGCCCPTGSR